jgi:Haem-degrading
MRVLLHIAALRQGPSDGHSSKRQLSFKRPGYSELRLRLPCDHESSFCRRCAAHRKILNKHKTRQGDVSMKKLSIALAVGLVFSAPALADEECNIGDQVVKNLQAKLANVVNLPDANGGLFKPNRMWSAVVDRQGTLCSVIRSDPDAWPGSRSIAIAKASTANNFSNDKTALSTANLYSFTQPANTAIATTFPAGSLYGLNNSNPFNPEFQEQGTGIGKVPGGIITFGGE